jgi:hypothetical protein
MAAFTLASQLMFQMYSMVFRYIIVMSQRFPSAKELLLKSTTKLAIFVSILATASLVSTMSFCAFDDQFVSNPEQNKCHFHLQNFLRHNFGANFIIVPMMASTGPVRRCSKIKVPKWMPF